MRYRIVEGVAHRDITRALQGFKISWIVINTQPSASGMTIGAQFVLFNAFDGGTIFIKQPNADSFREQGFCSGFRSCLAGYKSIHRSASA